METIEYKLSTDLNIRHVDEIHNELSNLVENNKEHEFIFNAKAVEKIDTLSIQLFIVLFKKLDKFSIKYSWKDPSDALINMAELLGLEKELKLT